MNDGTPVWTAILVVGRKTPGDGRIEIEASLVEQLAAAPAASILMLLEGTANAGAAARTAVRLRTIDCACSKGTAQGVHSHVFLEAPEFRQLTPGDRLSLSQDTVGELRLRPAR